MLQEWHYYFENTLRWRNLRKITIAQVHGDVYAAGLMLMWACDLIVGRRRRTVRRRGRHPPRHVRRRVLRPPVGVRPPQDQGAHAHRRLASTSTRPTRSAWCQQGVPARRAAGPHARVRPPHRPAADDDRAADQGVGEPDRRQHGLLQRAATPASRSTSSTTRTGPRSTTTTGPSPSEDDGIPNWKDAPPIVLGGAAERPRRFVIFATVPAPAGACVSQLVTTPGGSVDTCRAAVFSGDGTYEVREFPVPAPPPGGAVLEVEAVGLCASDVAQLHGHKHVPGEVSPVVPGPRDRRPRARARCPAPTSVSRSASASASTWSGAAASARCAATRLAVLLADAALRLHAGPRRGHAGCTAGTASTWRSCPTPHLRAAHRERARRRSCRCSSRSPTSSTGSAGVDLQPGEIGRDPGPRPHGPHLRGLRQDARRGHGDRHRTAARRRPARRRAHASAPTT